jgi:hypothetical protein
METVLSIPTPNGAFPLALATGRSTIFIGANGAGKTRLGVYVEQQIQSSAVRRIAAHRSLAMSDRLQSISLDRALHALQEGHPDPGGVKSVHRWKEKPAVSMLSDYEFLLQALFADQSRKAIEHLEAHRIDAGRTPPETIISRLKLIWERLLPHRKLRLLELGIEVLTPKMSEGQGYLGSDMSDGERVIFYMLGHCLLAPKNSAVIIDEPELHVHKAILGRLWDAIEAARPDCAFLYITHDLDFVVTRPTAAKFVVRSYVPNQWEIEALPQNTDLPDRVISELVGSRQPVLFVEGERGSLDAAVYRSIYTGFMIQPIGSCDAVIHAVASFRRNGALHRSGSVRGCIDADARDSTEIDQLKAQGVHVLPVAEVENSFLLPEAFEALARSLEFSEVMSKQKLRELTDAAISEAERDIEAASIRYAVRRLNAQLKRLSPSAKSIGDLNAKFLTSVASIRPDEIAGTYREALADAVAKRDLAGILRIYDNKGLLSVGARILGFKGREELTEYAGRLLAAEKGSSLLEALRTLLPKIAT